MEVDWIDAVVLAEELAEIYSTPTPKGWPELKKVSNLYWIDCVLYNSRALIFIPRTCAWLLSKHDSSQSLTLEKTFLIQDNLNSNLSLFIESKMSCPGADCSLCRYPLALSEESWFQFCIRISWYRHARDWFLDDMILGAFKSIWLSFQILV